MTELYGGFDEPCAYCGAAPFEKCAPDCLEREEPLDIEQAQQFTEADAEAWDKALASDIRALDNALRVIGTTLDLQALSRVLGTLNEHGWSLVRR